MPRHRKPYSGEAVLLIRDMIADVRPWNFTGKVPIY